MYNPKKMPKLPKDQRYSTDAELLRYLEEKPTGGEFIRIELMEQKV